MRVMNRWAAICAAGVGWVGVALLASGAWFAAAPMARAATTLSPSVLPRVEAATFEVVAAKPQHDPLSYAQPLPMDLIPYQQRTDKYHSIGTAFAIGPDRYVTAGHVLRAGLHSLWGPLELRDSKGRVYAIGKIEKFSLRRDFVVFSLKHPPQHAATLPVDTHPAVNTKVYAVGNALGTGIVIRGGLYTSNTPEDQSGAWKWIRFSAAASPGNSGGPLLDQDGKVIGVVLMKSPDENLNYALPISQVLDAPDDEAVIDKNINYGFPLIQDTRLGSFKARFKLPMSLAQFNTTYLKHLHAFEQAQLEALLKHNASTMFPHGSGSARLLYAAPTHDFFPRLLTRKSNGDWSLSVKKFAKLQLADHGYIRMGSAGKHTRVALFHLHKPDDVTSAKLYHDPSQLMRLILKSGMLTRHIASAKIRITSLGKPIRDFIHTDAWQRQWQVRVWPLPFANSVWMVFSLPVPDGYVGFMSGLPAASERDYLINLEAMTNFFYTGYEGTLAQWQGFLKQRKLLPAAFRHIHLDISYGHRVRYRSPRLAFEVTPKVQQIETHSKLGMMFSFFHDRDRVVWGVSGVVLQAKPHGNDMVSILRFLDPKGDPSDSYKAAWQKVLHREAPNNGVASQRQDAMRIMGVAGGKAQSQPKVLYVVSDQRNGQPSRKSMKSRLDRLLQGIHVYEH